MPHMNCFQQEICCHPYFLIIFFLYLLLRFSSLPLVLSHHVLIMMYLGVVLLLFFGVYFLCLGFVELLGSLGYYFSSKMEILQPLFLQLYFPFPPASHRPPFAGIPIIYVQPFEVNLQLADALVSLEEGAGERAGGYFFLCGLHFPQFPMLCLQVHLSFLLMCH